MSFTTRLGYIGNSGEQGRFSSVVFHTFLWVMYQRYLNWMRRITTWTLRQLANAMLSIGQLTMNTKITTTESIIKAYSSDDCPGVPGKSIQKILLVKKWKSPNFLIVKLPCWLMLLAPGVKIYCLKQKLPFDVKLILLSRGCTMRLGAQFL